MMSYEISARPSLACRCRSLLAVPLSFLFAGLCAAALPAVASEPFALDPGAGQTSLARVAPSPDGTVLAAWTRGTRIFRGFGPDFHAQGEVMVRHFSATGEPLAPPLQVVDLPLDSQGQGGAWALRVASAAPGEGVVAWLVDQRIELRALAGDAVLDALVVPVRCEGGPNDRLRWFDLVAAGDGYWIAWSEVCPGLGIGARRLDRRGRPVGPELVLSGARSPGGRVALAAAGNGGFVAAWVEDDGQGGRRVHARRLARPGAALGPVFAVSPPVVSNSSPVTPAVTELASGATLFAWNSDLDGLVIRSFPPGGGAPGPVLPASDGPPPNSRELGPSFAALAPGPPASVAALVWDTVAGAPFNLSCHGRLFDDQARPLAPTFALGDPCESPAAALSHAGTLATAWLTLCPTCFTEVADATEAMARFFAAPAGASPPGPPTISPEFPGFRFWVRMGGDAPDARLGVEEMLCLPETICFSGALPGRTEVLVRIVGPKENNFLWPNIVRFSTATVEVWIEQTATGALRYYRLEGATPGSDDLTGLFDRRGFRP